MTRVFIVMGHVGDCSEPYYVASTLSKAKSWIKQKAKDRIEGRSAHEILLQGKSLWTLERTKMENGFGCKQNSAYQYPSRNFVRSNYAVLMLKEQI